MSEVVIARGWGGARVSISETELSGFHIAYSAGGTSAPLPKPTLAAYIDCTALPNGEEFGHSCMHGPPPHRIKVLIFRSQNQKDVYERLRSRAAN
jgi:hypothetical protein